MNNLLSLTTFDWNFQQSITIVGLSLAVALLVHAVFAGMTAVNGAARRRGWLASIVYAVFAMLVTGLTVTSFGSIFSQGIMEHWALLAHISLAGIFVFAMLIFAVVWNPVTLSSTMVSSTRTNRKAWWLATASLWCVLIASVVVAGTMLIEMLPILDTEGMHELTDLHRYAGLLLVASLLVHVYSIVIQRLGWR